MKTNPNYLSFAKRINAAGTIADLQKLEKALDRLWNCGAGVFCLGEFENLDHAIVRKIIAIEEGKI